MLRRHTSHTWQLPPMHTPSSPHLQAFLTHTHAISLMPSHHSHGLPHALQHVRMTSSHSPCWPACHTTSLSPPSRTPPARPPPHPPPCLPHTHMSTSAHTFMSTPLAPQPAIHT